MTTLTAPSAGLAIAWPRWVPAAWTGFVLGALLLLDVVPLAVWSAVVAADPAGCVIQQPAGRRHRSAVGVDIVAAVQAAGSSFERQTIYRCLRRMTGHEPGSAHHDSKTSAITNCDCALHDLAHVGC